MNRTTTREVESDDTAMDCTMPFDKPNRTTPCPVPEGNADAFAETVTCTELCAGTVPVDGLANTQFPPSAVLIAEV